MNITTIHKLNDMATHLDRRGQHDLADRIDSMIKTATSIYDSISSTAIPQGVELDDIILSSASLQGLVDFLSYVLPRKIEHKKTLIKNDKMDPRDFYWELKDFYNKAIKHLVKEAKTKPNNPTIKAAFDLMTDVGDEAVELKRMAYNYDISAIDIFDPPPTRPMFQEKPEGARLLLNRVSDYETIASLIASDRRRAPAGFMAEVARGHDIEPHTTPHEGRNKLLSVLREKHPEFMKMAEQPGMFSQAIQQSSDDDLTKFNDPHLYWHWASGLLREVSPSIEEDEYIASMIAICRDDNKETTNCPLSYFIPSETAIKLMENIASSGLMEPSNGDVIKTISDIVCNQAFNPATAEKAFQLAEPIIELVRDDIEDKYDYDKRKAIINGFMPPDITEAYIRENPHAAKYLRRPSAVRDYESLVEEAEQSIRQKAEESTDDIDQALNTGAVTISRLDQDPVIDLIATEGRRLGLPDDMIRDLAAKVPVYHIKQNQWRNLTGSDTFLGVKTYDKRGWFSWDYMDHTGTERPYIVILDKPEAHRTSTMMDNLGISKEEMESVHLAHEAAHWLTNLRSGDLILDSDEDDKFDYLSGLSESIAYGHGQLPMFFDIIRRKIMEMINAPAVQKMLEDHAYNMVMTSPAARMYGIAAPEDIAAQKKHIENELEREIPDYAAKRLRRQRRDVLEYLRKLQEGQKYDRLRTIKRKLDSVREKIDASEGDPEEQKRLSAQAQELETQMQMIFRGKVDVSLDDAAQAIAHGYIKDYFANLAGVGGLYASDDDKPSFQELQDQANWIVDQTFTGVRERSSPLMRDVDVGPRQLTTRSIPMMGVSDKETIQRYQELPDVEL